MLGIARNAKRRSNTSSLTKRNSPTGMRWSCPHLSAGKSAWTSTSIVPSFTGPGHSAREEFKEYILSLSQPNREALAFARQLADSGKYLMGTINNESRDLNVYRIEKFGLRSIFSLFISSCFVGLRKPEIDIYRLALETRRKRRKNAALSMTGLSTSRWRSGWACMPLRWTRSPSCAKTC